MTKSYSDAVADRVLSHFSDGGAFLAGMWRDEDDRTVVRVSAGSSCSLTTLQRVLRTAMPLARVRVGTSDLDGGIQAQVTIPTKRDELQIARAHVAALWWLRALRAASAALFFAGAGLWLAEAR